MMVAQGSLWRRINKNKIAYLWIAPFFIQFLIFWAWPIVHTFLLSFQRWELLGEPESIGLDNYRTLFQDDWFWTVLGNNFYYWFAIVPLRTFLVLALAYILNSRVRFSGFFRTSFIMPYLISEVFIGLLFSILLAEKGGSVNLFLDSFGIGPIPWLSSKDWSKISVSLMTYWAGIGYFTVIMLGGLQRISPDYIEAALIDGATQTRIFFAIIIPLMLPTILFVTIISTIGTFSIFEGPLILTNGGPGISSTPLTLLLVNNAFQYFKMGYASTIAVVLFFIIFVVSLLQIKLLRGGSVED